MIKGKIKFKKKQLRTATVAAIAMALTAGITGTVVTSVKAAPPTWQDISSWGESDLTTFSSYDIKSDCTRYGYNQTLDASPTGNIYTGTNHHYDNIVGNESSRVMYAHKLRVADGMTIGIVAAQEDTEDEGGLTYLKGNNSGENLYFYWSIGEYDADGNLMLDGDWRGVNESWTVGQERNHDTYGTSGYPYGVSQSERQQRVTYIMPVFRWAKGSLAVGGGMDNPFHKQNLHDSFEIIQLVT